MYSKSGFAFFASGAHILAAVDLRPRREGRILSRFQHQPSKQCLVSRKAWKEPATAHHAHLMNRHRRRHHHHYYMQIPDPSSRGRERRQKLFPPWGMMAGGGSLQGRKVGVCGRGKQTGKTSKWTTFNSLSLRN